MEPFSINSSSHVDVFMVQSMFCQITQSLPYEDPNCPMMTINQCSSFLSSSFYPSLTTKEQSFILQELFSFPLPHTYPILIVAPHSCYHNKISFLTFYRMILKYQNQFIAHLFSLHCLQSLDSITSSFEVPFDSNTISQEKQWLITKNKWNIYKSSLISLLNEVENNVLGGCHMVSTIYQKKEYLYFIKNYILYQACIPPKYNPIVNQSSSSSSSSQPFTSIKKITSIWAHGLFIINQSNTTWLIVYNSLLGNLYKINITNPLLISDPVLWYSNSLLQHNKYIGILKDNLYFLSNKQIYIFNTITSLLSITKLPDGYWFEENLHIKEWYYQHSHVVVTPQSTLFACTHTFHEQKEKNKEKEQNEINEKKQHPYQQVFAFHLNNPHTFEFFYRSQKTKLMEKYPLDYLIVDRYAFKPGCGFFYISIQGVILYIDIHPENGSITESFLYKPDNDITYQDSIENKKIKPLLCIEQKNANTLWLLYENEIKQIEWLTPQSALLETICLSQDNNALQPFLQKWIQEQGSRQPIVIEYKPCHTNVSVPIESQKQLFDTFFQFILTLGFSKEKACEKECDKESKNKKLQLEYCQGLSIQLHDFPESSSIDHTLFVFDESSPWKCHLIICNDDILTEKDIEPLTHHPNTLYVILCCKKHYELEPEIEIETDTDTDIETKEDICQNNNNKNNKKERNIIILEMEEQDIEIKSIVLGITISSFSKKRIYPWNDFHFITFQNKKMYIVPMNFPCKEKRETLLGNLPIEVEPEIILNIQTQTYKQYKQLLHEMQWIAHTQSISYSLSSLPI